MQLEVNEVTVEIISTGWNSRLLAVRNVDISKFGLTLNLTKPNFSKFLLSQKSPSNFIWKMLLEGSLTMRPAPRHGSQEFQTPGPTGSLGCSGPEQTAWGLSWLGRLEGQGSTAWGSPHDRAVLDPWSSELPAVHQARWQGTKQVSTGNLPWQAEFCWNPACESAKVCWTGLSFRFAKPAFTDETLMLAN